MSAKPEVIVIERAEGCRCTVVDLTGREPRIGEIEQNGLCYETNTDMGDAEFAPCPHGSRVLGPEAIPAVVAAKRLGLDSWDFVRASEACEPPGHKFRRAAELVRYDESLEAARRVREAENGAPPCED